MADKDVEYVLDVRGRALPMPIVKTKKAVNDLTVDGQLEVLITDPGSVADFAANWY